MPELHIINLIIASLPETYARARSNWSLVPEIERTIGRLTSHLKAEEVIIKSYGKTTLDVALVANKGIHSSLTDVNSTIHLSYLINLHCLHLFVGPAPKSGNFRNHEQQEDHNSGDGYGRDAKRGRRDGRRGRGRGASNGPPPTTDPSTSSQTFDCIWCRTNTHMTADCFSMARAKKARQEKFKQSENKK